ncbi:PR domain zinc finger protein 5 [Folsomia candida]|uniref:PR domain zinc finger protein 5 n=1 Tax=Folsomia candida TaxID=158441 RepID=A0A226DW62_FOLCA|nr:PR domain zinc finger protein 5 [Folsomia candida]
MSHTLNGPRSPILNILGSQTKLNTEGGDATGRKMFTGGDQRGGDKTQRFKCPNVTCERVFSSKMALSVHCREMHTIPGGKLCERCVIIFPSQEALDYHVRQGHKPVGHVTSNCSGKLDYGKNWMNMIQI